MNHARGFDFDHWAALARDNPVQFERDRRAALVRAMRAVPPHRRQRLRGLQWRIDQVRLTSRSPLAACIRISHMMWEAIEGEHGLAAVLREPRAPGRPSAQIIPLRRAPHNN